MRMFTVFYADQVHDEFDSTTMFNAWRRDQVAANREVYEGAYIYDKTVNEWWRMDMTPALLSDVPKRLRVLVLLLS